MKRRETREKDIWEKEESWEIQMRRREMEKGNRREGRWEKEDWRKETRDKGDIGRRMKKKKE